MIGIFFSFFIRFYIVILDTKFLSRMEPSTKKQNFSNIYPE